MDAQIIINLAQARANHEKSLAELRQLEAKFKAGHEYQQWANIVQNDADLLAKADELFRQEALSGFGTIKEKHAPAYDVAINKSITIPDEGAAIRWCITNFTPALALNKKVFETAAKAGTVPNALANYNKIPTVKIHSDLSEWLKGE